MKPRCLDGGAIARAKALREQYDLAPESAKPKIIAELARYPFYHIIDVAPGVETPGIDWAPIYTDAFAKVAAKLDFRGKRVLDIGCRDGAQALLMESMGAAEIYGIDNDFSPGLVNFLVPFKKSRLQCGELNLYDLARAELGPFDVVSCCGVIYHLQFPFWGLKQIRDMVRSDGLLILELAVLDGFGDLPMLLYATGDTSPYEGTSPTFYNLAGLQHALKLLDFSDLTVHEKFNTIQFNAERHFPEFCAENPTLKTMPVSRVILTCRKREAAPSFTRDYFEGGHGIHSAGKDRYL